MTRMSQDFRPKTCVPTIRFASSRESAGDTIGTNELAMHSHELLTTFTSAAAIGVCLFSLANYLRTTPIVILLIGGVLAGPEGLANCPTPSTW